VGFGMRQGGERPAELTRGWRCWAALLILAVIFGIAAAMYLAGSPLGAPMVEGIQGRYFLPLVPLLCLFGLRGRVSPGSYPSKLAIVLMLGANVAVLGAIGVAYYRL
jgi:FtsH-binding integral membrane protein